MSEDLETRINRGEMIDRFLKDAYVQEVFRTGEEIYYKRWKQAETPAQREEIRAEARAFDTLTVWLQGVVDDGTSAKHQLEQRNKS